MGLARLRRPNKSRTLLHNQSARRPFTNERAGNDLMHWGIRAWTSDQANFRKLPLSARNCLSDGRPTTSILERGSSWACA